MKLAKLLSKHGLKIAFVESCTAGMASALLARTPGISEHLCGSFVVYRANQKKRVLNISQDLIDKHTTESQEVVRQLAQNAYEITAEAHWVAAIVGDLGPGASEDKDGKVHICIYGSPKIECNTFTLKKKKRTSRMVEASKLLLNTLKSVLESQYE